MYFTDDPIADFHSYDAEREAELSKLPRCSECDERIQTDECYEFNGELICLDCLEKNHRKWVDDYID